MDLIEDEVSTEIAGATVSSGTVRGLIANVGRRVFFSRIPLLFLLTIMVVTVLFYMTMMVSYLAKSRERDSALMRTRGVGIAELLRLYTLEGIVMCLLALALRSADRVWNDNGNWACASVSRDDGKRSTVSEG